MSILRSTSGPARVARAARRAICVGATAGLAALVAACAPARLEPLEVTHPASPQAPEADVPQPASALRGGRVAATETEPAGESPPRHGAAHGAHDGGAGGVIP
jgi:hypothetical protein